MPISAAVIGDAVARYERERDRYLKLALRVADLCRTEVVEANAVRAQVTSRTKTVRSFEEKLKRFSRRQDKNFSTVDEVFNEISDFAGVRIATYRPEDQQRVADAVCALFSGPGGGAVEVDPKDKLNPAAGQFYRATHIQVYLPASELVGNFENLKGASCEVQVCSMMAHVWNEIEHDIGYKPEGEGPSDAERGLLETLGHLARAGDAAITRLLAANISRMTQQTGNFTDVHDFVARLRSVFPKADMSVNAGTAFDELSALDLTSLDEMRAALGDEVLDPAVAAQRIAAFNAELLRQDSAELILNPASADLVTIGLLHARSTDIVKRAAARSGASGSRLHQLATAFETFKSRCDGAREKAA